MGATVARVRTLSTRYSMYHRQHTRLMHRTRPQTPQTLRQPTVQEHCASRTPITRLNCGAVYMQSAPRPLSHPKPSPSPVTCTYAAPLSAKLQPSARRGALRPRCPRRHRCADLGYGAMIGPASIAVTSGECERVGGQYSPLPPPHPSRPSSAAPPPYSEHEPPKSTG